MATEENQGLGGLGSLLSTNDLSGRSSDVTNGNPIGSQYKNGSSLIMTLDTTASKPSFIVATSGTVFPIGVLDDTPIAAQSGKLKSTDGNIYKILAGTALATVGTRVMADGYGRAIAWTGAGAYMVGVTVEVGVANQPVGVLWHVGQLAS